VSKRSLALALALFAAVAPAAFAKAKSKLELIVKGADGKPVAGVHLTVTVTSGEAFSASGITDEKGRFKAEIPDFDRAYQVEAKKEGYVTRVYPLQPPEQGLRPGATAEYSVALTARGPIEMYNEGVQALQAKDTAAAAARFEEALSAKPDFKEARRVLPMIYLDLKQPEKALAVAEQELATDPADALALRDRFEALSALGRKEEAKAALHTLAEHDKSPEVGKLFYNAGVEAWNGKDAVLARKYFDEALAVDTRLYQAHVALAEIHIFEKKYDEAVADLDRALAITPRNFRAHERKIEILKAAGKAAEAAEAEKALAALKAAG
jgi:tetratricopeptide (TPR) repeat protein